MLKGDEDYVSLEVAKLLCELGYNEWEDRYWSKSLVVSEEAIAKYGELSDDGFFELTKEGGGKLDLSEIYTDEWHLDYWSNSNSELQAMGFGTRGFSAPLLYLANKWLTLKYGYDFEIMYETGGLNVMHKMDIVDTRRGVRCYFLCGSEEYNIMTASYENKNEMINKGLSVILKAIKEREETAKSFENKIIKESNGEIKQQ